MNMRMKATKLTIQLAVLAVLSLGLLSVIATAHWGEEHVIGTVTKVSDTGVTVKTADGKTVQVGFDVKTTYTRADQPIQKTGIKVGDRVVIHAEEVNEKLVAHTVQLGAAKAAPKSK